MTSAYFAPLVTLPTIIDAPGQYRTRCGETATIETVSARHDHGCRGVYDEVQISEGWHKSGRLYAGVESQNDIVEKVEA